MSEVKIRSNILWVKPLKLGLLALNWNAVARIDRIRITKLANEWMKRVQLALPIYRQFGYDDPAVEVKWTIGNMTGVGMHIQMQLLNYDRTDTAFVHRGGEIFIETLRDMAIEDPQIHALFKDSEPANSTFLVSHTYA